jgi:hypothetical protein
MKGNRVGTRSHTASSAAAEGVVEVHLEHDAQSYPNERMLTPNPRGYQPRPEACRPGLGRAME